MDRTLTNEELTETIYRIERWAADNRKELKEGGVDFDAVQCVTQMARMWWFQKERK